MERTHLRRCLPSELEDDDDEDESRTAPTNAVLATASEAHEAAYAISSLEHLASGFSVAPAPTPGGSGSGCVE